MHVKENGPIQIPLTTKKCPPNKTPSNFLPFIITDISL